MSEAAKEIKSILRLEDPPIGVRLFKPSENIPSNIELVDKKSRYCQVLMLTRHGETILLTPEKLGCPAAYMHTCIEESHCQPFRPKKFYR